MARLAYAPVVWRPTDTESAQVDLCSYRATGLFIPTPPSGAFDEPVGLFVASRPFGIYDGEPFERALVGTHEGPLILPVDAERCRVYDLPEWVCVLGETTFSFVNAHSMPVPARHDWRMFVLIDAR